MCRSRQSHKAFVHRSPFSMTGKWRAGPRPHLQWCHHARNSPQRRGWHTHYGLVRPDTDWNRAAEQARPRWWPDTRKSAFRQAALPVFQANHAYLLQLAQKTGISHVFFHTWVPKASSFHGQRPKHALSLNFRENTVKPLIVNEYLLSKGEL